MQIPKTWNLRSTEIVDIEQLHRFIDLLSMRTTHLLHTLIHVHLVRSPKKLHIAALKEGYGTVIRQRALEVST